MKFTFKQRGKSTVLSQLSDVVALRPADDLRESESTAGIMRMLGTSAAMDDSREYTSVGLNISATDRKYLERAGWLFANAEKKLATAARNHARVSDTEAVRSVFIDRGGNTLIATDLVTLQLPPDMSDAAATAQLKKDGLKLVRRIKLGQNLFQVRIPAKKPLEEAIGELQDIPLYTFAEPDLLQVITGRMTPTDPKFNEQWQHKNNGSNGGTAGADIKSELAWILTRGAGVRIAVIDNGMQVDHPDLQAGIIGGGHFEADGSGGANFVRHTLGDDGFPGNDHGTFCLGMAGARMNNNRGGCGSAPEADLLAIGCLNDQVGTQTTLARAVAYAANPSNEDGSASAPAGADVLACSLGPNGAVWDMSSVLELAIRTAAATGRGGRGLPIFWAVSNGPFEVSQDEVCSHPDVIGVGRANRNDLEDGSAFGPKLEFLAPGRDVFSTRQGSQYGLNTGTSFACPLAAGVAALVLSRHPTWTRDQLRDRLRQSCDKIGGVNYINGHHDDYGFGRINAEQAVQ